MGRPPYFAFYPTDFANDINVEAMTTLQVGAYMLLLCKAWQADPPASLPNDDQILARLARVDPAVWAEIKGGVLTAFRVHADGRLHSKRLRKEYDKALGLIKDRSKLGKLAAEARWGNRNKPGPDAAGMPDALPTHSRGNAIQTQTLKSPLPPSGGVAVADDDDPPGEVVDGAGSMVRLAPFSEAVAAWVAAKLPGWNAPGGIQANGHRRGMFEQRQRNPRWREHWRAAVARLGRSKRARGGTKGFEQGVRLDTFLKDDAFLDRVLEGEWDDEGAGDPPPPPVGRSKMIDCGRLDPMKLTVPAMGGSHGF